MKFKIAVFITIIALIYSKFGNAQSTNGQYNVKFPFSYYGLGELDNGNSGVFNGTGQAGVAYMTNNSINTLNPASIGNLLFKEVVIDFAGQGTSSSFANNGNTSRGFDFSVRRFQIAMKPGKHWGFSFGLKPFSKVSYNLPYTQDINGTQLTYTTYSQGTGTISQGFLIGSANFWKLSIGVEAGYLFGSLKNTEMVAAQSVISEPMSAVSSHTLSGFRFGGGIHYNDQIGEKLKLEVGGSLYTSLKMRHQDSLNVYNYDSTYLLQSKLYNNRYEIPLQWRAGFALTYDGQFTLMADYNRANWGKAISSESTFKYVNSDALSAAILYRVFKKNMALRRVEKLVVMGGFNYSNGYIQQNGHNFKDISGTAGFMWPIRGGSVVISPSISVGTRNFSGSNNLSENYTRFNLSLSIRDIWFKVSRWQ